MRVLFVCLFTFDGARGSTRLCSSPCRVQRCLDLAFREEDFQRATDCACPGDCLEHEEVSPETHQRCVCVCVVFVRFCFRCFCICSMFMHWRFATHSGCQAFADCRGGCRQRGAEHPGHQPP